MSVWEKRQRAAPLIEKKCPRCGKTFFPTGMWAYRVEGRYVCSYTCLLREREKIAEKRKHKRKKYDVD